MPRRGRLSHSKKEHFGVPLRHFKMLSAHLKKALPLEQSPGKLATPGIVYHLIICILYKFNQALSIPNFFSV